MGQHQQIQVFHPRLPEKIPGIDAPGLRAGALQTLMAAVHQHGKRLFSAIHLSDQRRIAVAHIDEIQNQHSAIPPFCGTRRQKQTFSMGIQTLKKP
jgi:hypothetical protein